MEPVRHWIKEFIQNGHYARGFRMGKKDKEEKYVFRVPSWSNRKHTH